MSRCGFQEVPQMDMLKILHPILTTLGTGTILTIGDGRI